MIFLIIGVIVALLGALFVFASIRDWVRHRHVEDKIPVETECVERKIDEYWREGLPQRDHLATLQWRDLEGKEQQKVFKVSPAQYEDPSGIRVMLDPDRSFVDIESSYGGRWSVLHAFVPITFGAVFIYLGVRLIIDSL